MFKSNKGHTYIYYERVFIKGSWAAKHERRFIWRKIVKYTFRVVRKYIYNDIRV
jgi:hypothetical protein